MQFVMAKYRACMKNKVTKLLTNYGKISLIWFYFSCEETRSEEWSSKYLMKTIRKLKPEILVNKCLYFITQKAIGIL